MEASQGFWTFDALSEIDHDNHHHELLLLLFLIHLATTPHHSLTCSAAIYRAEWCGVGRRGI